MTPEERRKYRAEHLEEFKARRRKRMSERKEERKEYMRKWISEHREHWSAMMRKNRAEDLNKNGVTKHSIRSMSGRILEKCHANLQGYEIHHCFGYDDAEKFIYIPKSLHIKIHQLLRDKKIPSDSDHWNVIRELVNSCEDYTYIRT